MEMVQPQNLCQIEIATSNMPRSLRFYAEVFGWHRVPAEIHDYAVLSVPDDCPFGISLVPSKTAVPETAVSRVTLYFSVNDPAAIAARAKDFGGRLMFGPKVLPGYGACWQITDPDGQRLGLFTRGVAR